MTWSEASSARSLNGNMSPTLEEVKGRETNPQHIEEAVGALVFPISMQQK